MSARTGAKATIWATQDDIPFLVKETPGEVRAAIQRSESIGDDFVELTLGNPTDGWHGKPIHIRHKLIFAIGPPRNAREASDDDD